ncbi:MAG: type II toxin-antitoxin system Phd/YefM family antitoxin [Pseudoalteromonas prydzensis]|jgi:antitoxin StbD|uniref:type II toxin-antitoxin system Phd/YefM family antitoxin n=1 Tax=Pseudoalteromonas prydzensis TaxID=182141 RepID=UPI003F99B802
MKPVVRIVTSNIASVSDLKKNPMAVIEAAEGCPVAILNRNKPAFYCVPVEMFEAMTKKCKEVDGL